MKMPLWFTALGATLAMQINASMLDQAIAVLAPLLTAELGIRPQWVGAFTACSALGVVLFLLLGPPVIARLGAVRTLQVGAVLAAAGGALAASGLLPIILLGSLLIGIGYGPSPPAGSQILAASAPPRHRTLIFSIKQAGAPLGGAAAAVLLAPVGAALGWRAALILALSISLAAALLVQPLRRGIDRQAPLFAPLALSSLLSLRTAAMPLRRLLADPRMRSISCLAFSLALVQGCLFSFSVTYLATARGFSLTEAGLAYGVMQGAGAFARIGLGWLADRTGTPVVNLIAQSAVAALLVVTYGMLPAGAPFWLLVCMTFGLGFSAASWNGIVMAEIARLAAPGRVAEASAGGALVAFFGYSTGPLMFAALVWAFGDYRWPFALLGGQLLANVALSAYRETDAQR